MFTNSTEWDNCLHLKLMRLNNLFHFVLIPKQGNTTIPILTFLAKY